jgi:chorismate-pyruvate lyase
MEIVVDRLRERGKWEEMEKREVEMNEMNGMERVIMNNDGSMTRSLGNLLGDEIRVRVLLEEERDDYPITFKEVMLEGPFIYRQVVLVDSLDRHLLYAHSM